MPTIGDAWITENLAAARTIASVPEEDALISALIQAVYAHSNTPAEKSINLAAAFDLLVSADYYRSVAHANWVYCPSDNTPLLLYPFTNACPRCLLNDKFHFHQANKPKSGAIGSATSRLLALYLQHLFQHNGRSIQVYKGKEPVDLILTDTTTTPHTILFAEIKAAPLVTLPLAVPTQELTIEVDEEVQTTPHRISDNINLLNSPLNLFIPLEVSGKWAYELYPLGEKTNREDTIWAYRHLKTLLEQHPDFLTSYFNFWQQALQKYQQKSQYDIFWFTNACGQPNPRPDDWPTRYRASGHESISDSKTSVGMDRTDDLKKATYQVLKIGAEGKPTEAYQFKVGLVSNIHAVRHFDDYMNAFKDIIWTRDESGAVSVANDLPPQTELFNLFDGIISLTSVFARDIWI